jgi:myosin heavy subunit
MAALDGLKNKTSAMASGFTAGTREIVGMREKTEVLSNSLDRVGGSFGSLGSLARLALNPMTLGFVAVFGAVDMFNRSMERSQERMHAFLKESVGVSNIIRGIVGARPTDTASWALLAEQISKIDEKTVDPKRFGDAFVDVQKGTDETNASAGQQQIEIEQQKIELLRDQGRISAADAAKRIAALKEQAVLQKNLDERKSIQDELSARKSELGHLNQVAAKSPSVESALATKDQADTKVEDLKKQMEDLPKAIAANANVIQTATDNAKGSSWAGDKQAWYQKAIDARDRDGKLQAQLTAAQGQFPGAVKAAGSADEDLENAKTYKARQKELPTIITGLQNKLGVTVDRQNKMTPGEMQKIDLEKQKKLLEPIHSTKAPTSFEKMGFVMGGQNYQQQVVNNTAKANILLGQILGALGAGGGGGGGATNEV